MRTVRFSGAMDLTAKEEKFSQHVALNHNAAAGYRHAYDVHPNTKQETVERKALEIMARQRVKDRIAELRNMRPDVTRTIFTRDQAYDRWMDIATADPRELMGLRIGACRRCWGDGHGYQWRTFEYTEALTAAERDNVRGKPTELPDIQGGLGYDHTAAPNPSCPACGGEGEQRIVPRDTNNLSPQALLLYGGVKAKRDGSIEILIADRLKALEHACRVAGVYDDKVRLSGAIAAMNHVVQIETDDPKEAARKYQELMASIAS